jgi:transcription elongation factor GreA
MNQIDDKMLLTKEGLKKLEEELEYLKTGKRREIALRLQEAISYGDLSENAEYEEAKNEQAFMEGRIRELESMIKNAKIIGSSKKSGNTVNLGSMVTIQNIEDKEKSTYTIVGTTEVDTANGKISNESPIGKSLIDAKVGDVVSYKSPSGITQCEILKIE